jgi:hypothetical protein
LKQIIAKGIGIVIGINLCKIIGIIIVAGRIAKKIAAKIVDEDFFLSIYNPGQQCVI